MWIPWPYTMAAAVVLAAFAWFVKPRRRALTAVTPFAQEAALVLVLYSLWRIAGKISVRHTEGAEDRALWIWHAQHWLHLPSELAMQRAVLPHAWLMQAANLYYAIAHVPAAIAMLLWLFVRHREHYPSIRNVLAILTGTCLVLQLIAVMPPRFLPSLGFVDTAHLYGQSVYPQLGRGANNQLSAMPSLHVGWAVLVAVAVVTATSSRWRWLVIAHPVATCLAVVVTANHWWLDGIVAVAILAVAIVVERGAQRGLACLPVGPTDGSIEALDGFDQRVFRQRGEAQPEPVFATVPGRAVDMEDRAGDERNPLL